MHSVAWSVLFIASFACNCLAKDETVANVNVYIDKVLEDFRNDSWILNKINPLQLPDVKEKNYELTDGNVIGLSSLYRHGDCSLGFEKGKTLIMIDVAVRDILINGNYAVKRLFVWFHGDVLLTVDDLAVKMILSISQGKAIIDQFKVAHLGTYRIKKITGASFAFNWILKLISNPIAKRYRMDIIEALETSVAVALNDLFTQYEIRNIS